MRKINKFGIANFKPFGEKVQKFDLKPITLIYGPNSIGKSSVIHSLAYFNNLYNKSQFSPFEIKEGDTINLGGFENFIHKKNIDNKLNLEFTYDGHVYSKIERFNLTQNSFDTLRTGKISFEERKELLRLSPKNIYDDIKNAFINSDICVHINDGGTNFFYWLDDVFNDFDLNKINFSELETFVFETKEHETKLFFSDSNIVIPPYRYTEKIYNYPLGLMEEFYNQASKKTKNLLNIHRLYSQRIKKEKFIDNEWVEELQDSNENEYLREDKFELTEDFFMDALKKATDEELKAFSDDIYTFIQNQYNFNDQIKINTTIGKNNSNEVCDLETVYSIGEQWVFKALHKDTVQELELKEENYCFFINPDHEFVKDILFNIRKYGSWTDEQNIEEHFNKYVVSDNEGKRVAYARNSFIGSSESFLLSDVQVYASDINTFMEWNFDIETNYLSYLRKSSAELAAFTERMKNKENGDDIHEDDFDISDEVYERISSNQKLLDACEEFDIHDMSSIIALIIFSWISDLTKNISHNSAMRYIGPLRSFPERHEFSYANRAIDSNASTYAWEQLKHDEKLQKKINFWLSSDKLKTPYELKKQKHIKLNDANLEKLKGIFGDKRRKNYKDQDFMSLDQIEEFSFFDKRYDTPVNIREMGLGVSQVLPILVSLLSDKKHTIAVEQPELHLHPAVQSDLADEFIKSYKINSNSSLVETHSEHLLLRLMKRMRQTVEGTLSDENLALTPDDVSILYVDADDSKTYILELQLDEDGSLLDPWPGGFFEEGFTERFF